MKINPENSLLCSLISNATLPTSTGLCGPTTLFRDCRASVFRWAPDEVVSVEAGILE